MTLWTRLTALIETVYPKGKGGRPPYALYDGRPFRTPNVIDEGNREALRIECGTSIPGHRLTHVMSELVEVYGKPGAIRLDNGPEITSHLFTDWAKHNEIKLMFIQPGKFNQNAFIERFNRSFRTEVLNANLFDSVSEVQVAAGGWLTDYNQYRSHEPLCQHQLTLSAFSRNILSHS